MTTAPAAITVLILGGLGQDYARHLVPFLLSPAGPSPAFVRIVDKSLVIPAADAYTVYVDTEMKKALKEGTASGQVEYIQGNLNLEATRTRAFTLPEAHGGPAETFSYVFDFTGEINGSDQVHVERTLSLALQLGQAAANHRVGAYIRVLAPFYKSLDKKQAKVGAKGVVSEPWGTRASWFHEVGRGLGKIQGLKLVLIRPALVYGPYSVTGVTPNCLIAECYRYQNENFELLWGDSLELNTIHVRDFASSAVAVAEWAYKTPTADLLALAGEILPTTLKSNDLVKAVSGAALKDETVEAPVINLVDDGHSTQGTMAQAIAQVVGVQVGFHNALISNFAKMNLKDVLEDVNEKHLDSWSELLQASNPPMSTTVPISPHMSSDQLSSHPILFDADKLHNIVGWKPTYSLTADVIRDTVDKFKAEGHWPNAAPKSKK